MGTKNSVFIDTSFFKAVIDEKDDFHVAGLEAWETAKNQRVGPVTTNYILDETYTLIRKRRGTGKAKELRDFLAGSAAQIKIVRVLAADDAAAWHWFLKDWTNLSFTDCVSLAVMKRLGLERVLAFDRHFAQAGFKILAAD
jgi:predicted nucleic acid-binding protein